MGLTVTPCWPVPFFLSVSSLLAAACTRVAVGRPSPSRSSSRSARRRRLGRLGLLDTVEPQVSSGSFQWPRRGLGCRRVAASGPPRRALHPQPAAVVFLHLRRVGRQFGQRRHVPSATARGGHPLPSPCFAAEGEDAVGSYWTLHEFTACVTRSWCIEQRMRGRGRATTCAPRTTVADMARRSGFQNVGHAG